MGRKLHFFAIDGKKKVYAHLPTQGLTTRSQLISYHVFRTLGNKDIPLRKDRSARFFIVKNLPMPL